MGAHKVSGEYLLPDSGVIMSSGLPADFCWNDSDENSMSWKLGGDADLTAVAQQSNIYAQTNDACVIEFEFKCAENFEAVTSEVSFDYIFGSKEYYEYVGSSFNDAFAFFMNGENIAKLPDGETIVSINTVNYDTNEEYFIGDDINAETGIQYHHVEADGCTVKLRARARPIEGWNTIELAIADVSDHILDSWVLLEGGSFACKELTAAPSIAPSKIATSPTTVPTKALTMAPTPLPTSLADPPKPLRTLTSVTAEGISWPAGGPCMNEVFKAYGNNNDLQCTAKEVTTIATHVEGPLECVQGSTITVNLTISIDFHATRYDFHMYTYTGTQNADSVFEEHCALDHLS